MTKLVSFVQAAGVLIKGMLEVKNFNNETNIKNWEKYDRVSLSETKKQQKAKENCRSLNKYAFLYT